MLEFILAMGMHVVNTAFKMKYSKQKAYQSGNACNQTDYVLGRKANKKRITDIKSY